jgi:hypothetical protein
MNRLQANRLGPAGLQNNQELLSMYLEILSMCTYVPLYPAETREMQYQIKKKSIYWYVLSTYQYKPFYEPEVCTGYILLNSSMYFKTYFITSMYHVCTWYIPGTYGKNYVLCTYLG